MKKIFFAMPLLALALASCDPSDIDGGSEWEKFDTNNLQVTATPKQVDGKNSNQVDVVCSSPVNVAWEADQLAESKTHTVASAATIYFTQLGKQKVRCLTTNVGGAPDTTYYEVQIDTISYLSTELTNRLCIGTTGAPDHFGIGFNKDAIVFKQTVCNNGKKGNSIVVSQNNNPVLCTFKWGNGKMTTSVGKLTTYALGESDLTVDVLDAAGNSHTVNLGKFNAEDYSDLPAAITQITGYDPVTSPNATKTWKLEEGNNWGNGGNNDKAGSWWTTDVTGQGGSYGTMTFDFPNGKLTKVVSNEANKNGDKSGVGTFNLDFSKTNEATNVICGLTTKGSNIVFPYLINEAYKETHTFEVVSISDKDMWIRAQHSAGNSSTWEGTFWHFYVVKDE